MDNRHLRLQALTLAVALGNTLSAVAMESIDDGALADVSGQSGIDLYVRSNAIGNSGTSVLVNIDDGTANEAGLLQSALQLTSIGNQGAATTTPFVAHTQIDVASVGGQPALALQSDWTRMRASHNLNVVDAAGTPASNGFGTMVMDTTGSFRLTGVNGLLNGGASNSARQLHLTIGSPQVGVATPGSYGQIYYRQGGAGSPELVLDKIYLDLGLTPGTGGSFGFCDPGAAGGCGSFGTGRNGFYLNAPHLDFNASWAVNYRGTPTGSFTTANNDSGGLAYWGWTGGFNNAELLVSAGGIWTPTPGYDPQQPSGRSQGLNVAFHGDYDSNFAWLVGQAGGRSLLRFGNWTKLTGATYALNAPNVTLDVINASQGPGGLCWGASAYGTASGPCSSTTFTRSSGKVVTGQFLNLPPSATSLALAVRQFSLQAYSSNVQVLDDMNNNGVFTDTVGGIAETQTYPWGLIYTFGTLDGNVYLYPGNAAGTGNGMAADIMLMSQSFANGSNKLLGNTNFMISDSDTGMGIGLFQSNLLFAARKMYTNLLPGGLQMSTNDARLAIQGRFGGGSVPNLTQVNVISDWDINLEFSRLESLLYAASSNGYPYLGFETRMTLVNSSTSIASPDADGSYFALAEPSRPDVEFRVANLTGDLETKNGKLFLISAADTVNAPDQVRRLQIAQDIYIGSSVSGGGNPLIGEVKFSGASLGRIAIPSGQWYSSMTLKPQ